jgi:hypothetical protein
MDINAHTPPETPRVVPADPISSDLEHAQAHDPIPTAKTPATRRARFIMPSAEAIAEAIIRRALADLRG